jgi:hypothetical protein
MPAQPYQALFDTVGDHLTINSNLKIGQSLQASVQAMEEMSSRSPGEKGVILKMVVYS